MEPSAFPFCSPLWRCYCSFVQSYVEKILHARVYDVAKETPLDFAPKLSHRFGERVLLKREDLQPVFSFKLRGAFNKIVSLRPEQAKRSTPTAAARGEAVSIARRIGLE